MFVQNDRAMTENTQSGRRLQHRRSVDVLARETGAALPAAIQLPDVAPPGTTNMDLVGG